LWFLLRPLVCRGTESLARRSLALHLAIVHLADPSLTRRILEYFFAVTPDELHLELLTEYLIGNAYMSMQQVRADGCSGLFFGVLRCCN